MTNSDGKVITGAEMVVESLKKEGVDIIFGYPGGVVIPIFDVLFDDKDIKVILTRHEQGAVHAADGYARSSGKVGVVLVTSGPGATNTITGLATANIDSIPIIVITGQVPTQMVGSDAFQEADVSGITRPICKNNYLVKDIKELPTIIKDAFHIARTGRPGPIVIDLPKDISVSKDTYHYPEKVDIPGYNPHLDGHKMQIKKAAAMIQKAKKPIFYIGGGIILSGANEVLTRIAQKNEIPVLSSLLGLGGFPATNPLFLGMVGMHGTYVANMGMQECDLIIAAGCRFDDRVTGKLDTFAPHAKIIHIDIDPSAIAKNVKVEVPIVGDARIILEKLEDIIEKPDTANWRSILNNWREKHPLTYIAKDSSIPPQKVVQMIDKLTPADTIITTEVGQNQMFAALYYNYTKPRTFLTSGGLGTMGYGFPAAIGAKLANPDKVVIDIAGDGSIQMNIQELATATLQRLPVIIVILNNSYLGMVRQWQDLFYDKRYSSVCTKQGTWCPPACKGDETACQAYIPDFIKLADAYNAIGIRIKKEDEIENAIKEALNSKDKPVVLDFLVSREENVWPMVPSAAGLDEMLIEGERI